MSQRERVEIHWLDIVSDSSWIDQEEVIKKKPVNVYEIAYLVLETEEYIVVSHAVIDEANHKASDYTVIPWGAVVRIWNLKRNGVYAE